MNNYRHIPITSDDASPDPRAQYRKQVRIYWAIGIVVTLAVALFVPLGMLFVIPLLIGFATKRPHPPVPPEDHPYDYV